MRFMMLIKSDARTEAGVLPDDHLLTELGKYDAALVDAGVLLAADGLRASSLGARVRMIGHKVSVLEGPFNESGELLGGYWIVQVASKQEALEWARRAPFRDGEVELRQLFELEDFPVDPGEVSDGWRQREEQQRDAVPPRRPGTTRFITLLKADRNSEAGLLPGEQLLTDMGGLMQEMARAGVLLAGEGLQPSSKGARVLYAGAERRVLDGPFAEAEGLIAGFSVIQVKTKQDAVRWAERCLRLHVASTGIERGEIEVRQLYESNAGR